MVWAQFLYSKPLLGYLPCIILYGGEFGDSCGVNGGMLQCCQFGLRCHN